MAGLKCSFLMSAKGGMPYGPVHSARKGLPSSSASVTVISGSSIWTAAAAGLSVTPQDFADLSHVTPLLARIYPNGAADVNHFHAAGGMGFLVAQLLSAGLLHGDAQGVDDGLLRTPRVAV